LKTIFQYLFPEYDFYKDIEGNNRDLESDWDIGPYEYDGLANLNPLIKLWNYLKNLFVAEEQTSVTGNAVLSASSLEEDSSEDSGLNSLDSSFDLIGFEKEVKIVFEYFLKEVLGVDVSVRNIGIGYVIKETGEEDFINFVFDLFL